MTPGGRPGLTSSELTTTCSEQLQLIALLLAETALQRSIRQGFSTLNKKRESELVIDIYFL